MNPLRLFTVCRGVNRAVDLRATETVRRLLLSHGLKPKVKTIWGMRVFIVEESPTVRTLANSITKRYGTSRIIFWDKSLEI